MSEHLVFRNEEVLMFSTILQYASRGTTHQQTSVNEGGGVLPRDVILTIGAALPSETVQLRFWLFLLHQICSQPPRKAAHERVAFQSLCLTLSSENISLSNKTLSMALELKTDAPGCGSMVEWLLQTQASLAVIEALCQLDCAVLNEAAGHLLCSFVNKKKEDVSLQKSDVLALLKRLTEDNVVISNEQWHILSNVVLVCTKLKCGAEKGWVWTQEELEIILTALPNPDHPSKWLHYSFHQWELLVGLMPLWLTNASSKPISDRCCLICLKLMNHCGCEILFNSANANRPASSQGKAIVGLSSTELTQRQCGRIVALAMQQLSDVMSSSCCSTVVDWKWISASATDACWLLSHRHYAKQSNRPESVEFVDLMVALLHFLDFIISMVASKSQWEICFLQGDEAVIHFRPEGTINEALLSEVEALLVSLITSVVPMTETGEEGHSSISTVMHPRITREAFMVISSIVKLHDRIQCCQSCRARSLLCSTVRSSARLGLLMTSRFVHSLLGNVSRWVECLDQEMEEEKAASGKQSVIQRESLAFVPIVEIVRSVAFNCVAYGLGDVDEDDEELHNDALKKVTTSIIKLFQIVFLPSNTSSPLQRHLFFLQSIKALSLLMPLADYDDEEITKDILKFLQQLPRYEHNISFSLHRRATSTPPPQHFVDVVTMDAGIRETSPRELNDVETLFTQFFTQQSLSVGQHIEDDELSGFLTHVHTEAPLIFLSCARALLATEEPLIHYHQMAEIVTLITQTLDSSSLEAVNEALCVLADIMPYSSVINSYCGLAPAWWESIGLPKLLHFLTVGGRSIQVIVLRRHLMELSLATMSFTMLKKVSRAVCLLFQSHGSLAVSCVARILKKLLDPFPDVRCRGARLSPSATTVLMTVAVEEMVCRMIPSLRRLLLSRHAYDKEMSSSFCQFVSSMVVCALQNEVEVVDVEKTIISSIRESFGVLFVMKVLFHFFDATAALESEFLHYLKEVWAEDKKESDDVFSKWRFLQYWVSLPSVEALVKECFQMIFPSDNEGTNAADLAIFAPMFGTVLETLCALADHKVVASASTKYALPWLELISCFFVRIASKPLGASSPLARQSLRCFLAQASEEQITRFGQLFLQEKSPRRDDWEKFLASLCSFATMPAEREVECFEFHNATLAIYKLQQLEKGTSDIFDKNIVTNCLWEGGGGINKEKGLQLILSVAHNVANNGEVPFWPLMNCLRKDSFLHPIIVAAGMMEQLARRTKKSKNHRIIQSGDEEEEGGIKCIYRNLLRMSQCLPKGIDHSLYVVSVLLEFVSSKAFATISPPEDLSRGLPFMDFSHHVSFLFKVILSSVSVQSDSFMNDDDEASRCQKQKKEMVIVNLLQLLDLIQLREYIAVSGNALSPKLQVQLTDAKPPRNWGDLLARAIVSEVDSQCLATFKAVMSAHT